MASQQDAEKAGGFLGYRKALKEHRCNGCSELIKKGQRYWRRVATDGTGTEMDGAYCAPECEGKVQLC